MRNRFQNLHTVLNMLGALFIMLGFLLLVPIIVFFIANEYHYGWRNLFAFLGSALLSLLLGGLLRFVFKTGVPNLAQAMLICALAWLGFSVLGALPFVFGLDINFLDGFFEAMSGFTTTGMTLLTRLDYMAKSLLFWRSLTQWIGGLGILTFFLAISYRCGSAHMLFGAESHKIGIRRPVPGLLNTLKIFWLLYIGFTLFVFIALLISGMPFFDSILHSFSSLSTGGFSNHDVSIAYYQMAGFRNYIWFEYILIIGMILGGTNFIVHYRIINREWKALFDNTEMRYWWGLIIFFLLIIFIERVVKIAPHTIMQTNGSICWPGIEENFRQCLFQVVAIITTTGFSTKDIGSQFFGTLAQQLFLVMMVIGGCVGSTGGGFKILRVAILVKLIKRELLKLRAPAQSFMPIIIDGEIIKRDEIYRVAGLFFAWLSLLICGGMITAFFSDLNTLQSFSGMFSALGNIGPSYIPTESLFVLNPVIKIAYIIGMLAGRLELLPVFLLFSSRAWR